MNLLEAAKVLAHGGSGKSRGTEWDELEAAIEATDKRWDRCDHIRGVFLREECVDINIFQSQLDEGALVPNLADEIADDNVVWHAYCPKCGKPLENKQ